MPVRFTVHLTASFQRDLQRLPTAAQQKVCKCSSTLRLMGTILKQMSRFATVKFLIIIATFTELFGHICCFFSLIILRFQSNSPAFSRHFKSPKFEGVKLARFLQNRTCSDVFLHMGQNIEAAHSPGVGDRHDVAFSLCIKPDSYSL